MRSPKNLGVECAACLLPGRSLTPTICTPRSEKSGDSTWATQTAIGLESEEGGSGMKVTLTFPGLSAKKVVGTDALNGFEQEILISTQDGNTIVNNLLIKDYPIILCITDNTLP